MMKSKTLNAKSWAKEFREVEGKAVERVRITGFGNGGVINMAGAEIDYIDYLPGEGGVLLNFMNGVVIRCGECEVVYD